jgi:hypothetical protein
MKVRNFNQFQDKVSFVKRLGTLGDFLVYDIGMRKVVDEYFKPWSTVMDYNQDQKFQKPLEILFNTGKYPSIKFDGGRYYCPDLKKTQIIVGGKWHPCNKLNTNAFDQAEVIYDLMDKVGKLDEISELSSEGELKTFLKKFFSENDILKLIKDNDIRLSKYTHYNRIFSEKGERAERQAANFLENDGWKIEYTGGDGDPIDMTWGIDLIVSKNGDVKTVQVKTKTSAALSAKKKAYYRRIDFFISTDGGVTFV